MSKNQFKIAQVQFRHAVNIGSTPEEFLDVTKLQHSKLAITEERGFLIISGLPGTTVRQQRVPMSNVAFITEVPEVPVEKPKEDSGIALSGASGGPRAGEKPPAPLPAARVTAPETAS